MPFHLRGRSGQFGIDLARFDLQPGHSATAPALRRIQSPEEVSPIYEAAMREARTVDFGAELISPLAFKADVGELSIGVIVAAFGGLVGVVVGVGLGILATQKMPEFLVNTTAVPVGQLVLYVIVAAITGLGAGAFPAWIAGRMNVLDAISNE